MPRETYVHHHESTGFVPKTQARDLGMGLAPRMDDVKVQGEGRSEYKDICR